MALIVTKLDGQAQLYFPSSVLGTVAVIIVVTLILLEGDGGYLALEERVLECFAHLPLLKSEAGKEAEKHGAEENLQEQVRGKFRRFDKICRAIITYTGSVDHCHALRIDSLVSDLM